MVTNVFPLTSVGLIKYGNEIWKMAEKMFMYNFVAFLLKYHKGNGLIEHVGRPF